MWPSLTKVGRDFAYLASKEKTLNMHMRLLLLRTMQFFLQARPKRKKEKLKHVLQWLLLYAIFFGIILKIAFFVSQDLFLTILFLEPNDQQPDRRV
jgi:hypothetical protein